MVVEFTVEDASPPTVRGRVTAGAVRVGDVFTTAVSDAAFDVSLQVVEVRRYGHLLDEAETVHAAELLLTGEAGTPSRSEPSFATTGR